MKQALLLLLIISCGSSLRAQDDTIYPADTLETEGLGNDTTYIPDEDPLDLRACKLPKRDVFLTTYMPLFIPQHNYGNNVHRPGLGVGFGVYYQPFEEKPFYLGFNGSYAMFQRVKLKYEEYADEITRTNTWIWTLSGRYLQPVMINWIQPYGEAYIGAKSLATRTVIGDSDDESPIFKRHSRDWTYVLGLGVGAMIPITFGLTADIEVGYQVGGYARYHALPKDYKNQEYDYGIDAFDLKHSETDLLCLRIGISALLY